MNDDTDLHQNSNETCSVDHLNGFLAENCVNQIVLMVYILM